MHRSWRCCQRTTCQLATRFAIHIEVVNADIIILAYCTPSSYKTTRRRQNVKVWLLLSSSNWCFPTHYWLLATHYLLLATNYLLLATDCSLLTTYCSLLTAYYLLLNYLLLTTHYSLLEAHFSLLTRHLPAVLISIIQYFKISCTYVRVINRILHFHKTFLTEVE